MTTSCSGLLLLASLLEDRPFSGMFLLLLPGLVRSTPLPAVRCLANMRHLQNTDMCHRGKKLANEYLFHQADSALFLASNRPPLLQG